MPQKLTSMRGLKSYPRKKQIFTIKYFVINYLDASTKAASIRILSRVNIGFKYLPV